jgi:hypothetical protein
MSKEKMTAAQRFTYCGAWLWILANVSAFSCAVWLVVNR